MRFLISRLSSLGDVVCTLPAAGALKNGFPYGEIVWVVDPRFKSVVERCRFVDEVIEARPGFSRKSWPAFEGEFDAALDMQGLLKSAVPVWRAKAKKKLGYHWQREGAWLFSQRVLPDPSSLHVVDQYVDVARAAGGTAHTAEFGLSSNEDDKSSVRELMGNSDEASFVVLNPGGAWASKRWPAQHFAKVCDQLSEAGFGSVLIGTSSPVEMAGAEEVACHCQRNHPISLVGKTSIGQLIALIERCAAHVGGDTGSTHIAAALGKPAIGLYSATRPERTCPYRQFDRCLYDPVSLSNIKPEKVSQVLLEALGA